MKNIVTPTDALRRTGTSVPASAGAAVDLALLAQPAGSGVVIPTVLTVAAGTF